MRKIFKSLVFALLFAAAFKIIWKEQQRDSSSTSMEKLKICIKGALLIGITETLYKFGSPKSQYSSSVGKPIPVAHERVCSPQNRSSSEGLLIAHLLDTDLAVNASMSDGRLNDALLVKNNPRSTPPVTRNYFMNPPTRRLGGPSRVNPKPVITRYNPKAAPPRVKNTPGTPGNPGGGPSSISVDDPNQTCPNPKAQEQKHLHPDQRSKYSKKRKKQADQCDCNETPENSKKIDNTEDTKKVEANENDQKSKRKKSQYDRVIQIGDREILIEDSQVKKKFHKHKKHLGIIANEELGIKDNQNQENYELFKDKLIEHMLDPNTKVVKGTFRRDIDVTHYFNEDTNLNVMLHAKNNTF